MIKKRAWDSRQYSIPFGTTPGYFTVHGVVSVTTVPVQGHIFCPGFNWWVLHWYMLLWNGMEGRDPGGEGRKEENDHATVA
jgi:hypothetical protein